MESEVPTETAPPETEELRAIKEHQAQIKKWLIDVKRKIYEIETNYLEETQLGNIIRGWEIDRPPLTRVRGQCDEKERLFSYSSYEFSSELKQNQENGPGVTKHSSNLSKVANGPKMKKTKKRKSEFVEDVRDWNQGGDY